MGSRSKAVSHGSIVDPTDFLIALLRQFDVIKLKSQEDRQGWPPFKSNMFYDLNVPYSPDDPEVPHTLNFLAERKSFIPISGTGSALGAHERLT